MPIDKKNSGIKDFFLGFLPFFVIYIVGYLADWNILESTFYFFWLTVPIGFLFLLFFYKSNFYLGLGLLVGINSNIIVFIYILFREIIDI